MFRPKEWQIAEMLLQEMQQLHHQPTVACLNAALTAYSNAFEWESALFFFCLLDSELKADVVSLGPWSGINGCRTCLHHL
jgi:hypothetical protein